MRIPSYVILEHREVLDASDEERSWRREKKKRLFAPPLCTAAKCRRVNTSSVCTC